MIHSAQFFLEHLLYMFQNFQNLEPYFQIFQIPDPRRSVFWPGDVFGSFFGPEIINLFTILQILYKFDLMLHESFSYEPSSRYGINLFSKTIIKESK